MMIGWTIALGLMLGTAAGAQERTLTGEIVDPAGYLKDGRRGADLTEQTYEAVGGGQTLALLEDGTGTLYLFLAEQPGEDPNELAYDYVNQSVRVQGTVHERGGLKGVIASAVEPTTPPAAAEPTPAAETDDLP
jgi:hypothetical protein